MIAVMDKKRSRQPKRIGRPPLNPQTPVGGRSKKLLPARITPEVLDRFDAFVKSYDAKHRLRTDRSAHVEKALLEYLDSQEPLLRDENRP